MCWRIGASAPYQTAGAPGFPVANRLRRLGFRARVPHSCAVEGVLGHNAQVRLAAGPLERKSGAQAHDKAGGWVGGWGGGCPRFAQGVFVRSGHGAGRLVCWMRMLSGRWSWNLKPTGGEG